MISGHKLQFGVDTGANSSLVQGRILAQDAVNCAFREGDNDTRPSIQLLNLSFVSDEERELFETNVLTSLFGYDSVPPYTQDHIIATTGKYVWAGAIGSGNAVLMRIIYDALDPTLLQQFPVQASNILIINNGETDPIFWDGQTSPMRFCKDSPFIKDGKSIPIGNVATYCHGRIFIGRKDGTVYAGDHIYSQGITASSEVVLSFSESTYPSSGDGFTATAQWGQLTAIRVIDKNPSTNGHGEVIVYHEKGAYSINPLADRSQWTEQPIQQTVFAGIGAASPFAVTTVNNDHFFRTSELLVASLKITIAEKTNQFNDRSIAEEVAKYLRFDHSANIRFAMSGTEDDRVFFTVNHVYEKVGDITHRYALGLVSLDLFRGSNSVEDRISWDGLWTGPRVTGIANIGLGKTKKCIFASFDSDHKNRLYTLSNSRGSDITSEGERPIRRMYSFGSIFDGITIDAKDIIETTIKNNIIIYSDCVGVATVSSAYAPGYSGNWFDLFVDQQIGLSPMDNTLFYDIASDSFKGQSASDSVTEQTGNKAISSYVFAVRTIIEGSVIIKANFLVGDQKPMNLTFDNICPKQAGCVIDDYDFFNYIF